MYIVYNFVTALSSAGCYPLQKGKKIACQIIKQFDENTNYDQPQQH